MDFSLDLKSEEIKNSLTRKYFQEVLSSYNNRNYRSSIVMLYSVLICDLIYKLKDLSEIYNDDSAKSILTEIERLQTKNEKSPVWETKLFKLVKEKTKLLEISDYLHIESLQNHRHLCAHPVMNLNYELYSPNKETTRAHIRNILEGVLLKPALLSRKILPNFLNNLSEVKDILITENALKRHLKAKYFNNLNLDLLIKIFKSLWRLVFFTQNEQCNENRNVNLTALTIFIKEYTKELIQEIESDNAYYSKINVDHLKHLANLLNTFPSLFNKLDDSIRVLIEAEVKKDIDLQVRCIFLSDSITKHIELVKNLTKEETWEIRAKTIAEVYNILENEGHIKEANTLLINFFGDSNTYNSADVRYRWIVKPNIAKLNIEEAKLLLEKMNSNDQIFQRRGAQESNQYIRSIFQTEFGNSINYSLYDQLYKKTSN